jgi:hypothetical protein
MKRIYLPATVLSDEFHLLISKTRVEGERVRLAQQLCWESTYARRRRSLNLPVLGA